MEQRLKDLHEDTFTLYARLAVTCKWATEQLKKNVTNQEYCADVGFAMNELDKLVKDIGVEIRKVRELADTAAVVSWMQNVDDEPIRTEHCTATPKLKMQPKLPKKGTPELAQLLDWLGVKQNHDAVRIHWPSLCDIVTKRVEESQPLPPCIDASEMHNPTATLQYYKKKDVNE